MRFYLDHMVDAACAEVLCRAGHEAWTASTAGRARTTDDDQTVYAMAHHAALITHDVEFTHRRKLQPHGHHVRLMCREWDAADLLADIMVELVEVLRAAENLTVEVRPGRAAGRPTMRLWFGTETHQADQ